MKVPGYDVSVTDLPDSERESNLEMLRFISDEAAMRGLDFQLGLWTHAYEWIDIWYGANERVPERSESHRSIEDFEGGLRANDPAITSSQIYAWACARQGTPFASGSPNHSVGFAALDQLAISTGTPLAGSLSNR